MHNILHDGFLEDLPPALRITDQQQRGILAAMAVSDAPVHVIHALVGCGKSTVLHCIVALYAKRHARMVDSGLVFALRARTRRRELLQALLHNQALQPRQATGSASLWPAGSTATRRASKKIVLAIPEPSRLLPVD